MERDDPAYRGQCDYNRLLMRAYDPINLDDTADGLRDILSASFEHVEIETVGSIAIFTATSVRSGVWPTQTRSVGGSDLPEGVLLDDRAIAHRPQIAASDFDPLTSDRGP
jgi:hypothetical protein